MPTALLTGGAGYIGSHTAVVLLEAGWSVVIVDNLANSSPVAVERVAELTGRDVAFHRVDLLDEPELDAVFAQHDLDAVVHFAGLKAVGESVAKPLDYHENNVAATISLLKVMRAGGVQKLVFSSSCTVYGDPERVPVTEGCRLGPTTNPYGRSKLYIEDMLRDLPVAEAGWHIALLRYFNPVGAHPSGRIGEDPAGIPNNLMPNVMQVAAGRRDKVRVFGSDYGTPDGTGVRDYIHVVDLAEGHLAALERLDTIDGCEAVNLGTGRGYSVLEVIEAASRAAGRPIPYEVEARRPGDIAATWADPTHAREVLGWEARLGLDEMVVDHWRWQSENPEGYATGGGGGAKVKG
ncbi:MAG TPA: UDP-glucose 4-epimerase GalE [Acidimicrobiales bacterium]|nr:UDP-glucose 4-epimerase GalE [Acidimicrobiales bacterium]